MEEYNRLETCGKDSHVPRVDYGACLSEQCYQSHVDWNLSPSPKGSNILHAETYCTLAMYEVVGALEIRLEYF